jgi:hypothetical protein
VQANLESASRARSHSFQAADLELIADLHLLDGRRRTGHPAAEQRFHDHDSQATGGGQFQYNHMDTENQAGRRPNIDANGLKPVGLRPVPLKSIGACVSIELLVFHHPVLEQRVGTQCPSSGSGSANMPTHWWIT